MSGNGLTDRLTHTHGNYCNPRYTCAARVNLYLPAQEHLQTTTSIIKLTTVVVNQLNREIDQKLFVNLRHTIRPYTT